MADVVVRAVRAEDAHGVVALVRDVLAEFGLRFGEGADTDAELARLPASYTGKGGAFWIAEQGGELVGTCGVAPVAEGTLELRKMYLRPAARGLGAGERLLREALAFARTSGARRVVLDTTEQMTRAIAFYERHGFVRDDAQIRGCRCSLGYVLDLAAAAATTAPVTARSRTR